MTSKVVDLPCVTSLDIPPTKILKAAIGAKLKSCVVVGWSRDGRFWFASSSPAMPEVNWLLDLAKASLLEMSAEPDDAE